MIVDKSNRNDMFIVPLSLFNIYIYIFVGTAIGLPGPDSWSSESSEDSNETTAMSVLYGSEYVNGNLLFQYIQYSKSVCLFVRCVLRYLLI